MIVVFRSENTLNLLIAIFVITVATACVCNSNGRRGGTDTSRSPVATPKSDASPSKDRTSLDSKKNADNGDFTVEHTTLRNSRYAELERKVKEEKLLENAAGELNRALILPEDIFVTAKDCGEANAQFDPNDQTLTICYELMERFAGLYRSDGMSAAAADQKMFDAMRFVFLHEVGHALIYNYKLPIMGNEEDAADRCSSYINIEELGEKGVKAVLAAADGFRIDSRGETRSKRDLADEHLLQEQRFYNSLCMIYGAKPDKYGYFVTDGYLPRERAERCPQEYNRVVDSWVNLLSPWRKEK
jgi:hypothetical protein